jgi:hypothetical protein
MHKVLNHAPSDQPQRLSANYIPVERSWHGMSVRSRKTIVYRDTRHDRRTPSAYSD